MIYVKPYEKMHIHMGLKNTPKYFCA